MLHIFLLGSNLPHCTVTADGIGYICHHSGTWDDPHIGVNDFMSEQPPTISLSYLSNEEVNFQITPDDLSEKFLQHYEESFPGRIASIHGDGVSIIISSTVIVG